MRINLRQPIIGFDGKPLKQIKNGVETDTNIEYIDRISLALEMVLQEEKPTQEDKAKRAQLNWKIWGTEAEVELTANEIALIIERVNKIFTSPLVCESINKLLSQENLTNEN